MVLVQDVGDQVRTKVTAFDRQDAFRKRRQYRAAAGQVIACPQVACVFVLDEEFLDYVGFVAPESGPLGKALQTQRLLMVNLEFRSLRPLRRTGTLTAFFLHGLGLRRFQKTGLDIRTRFLSLEV